MRGLQANPPRHPRARGAPAGSSAGRATSVAMALSASRCSGNTHPPGLALVVFSASPTRICFFNASSFHCTWAGSPATPPAPPCTWRRSQRRAAKRHQRGLRTLHRSGPVPQGRRDRVHAQTPRHPQRPGPRQHAPKRKNRPKPHLNALTSNTVVSRATRHLGLVVVGGGGRAMGGGGAALSVAR